MSKYTHCTDCGAPITTNEVYYEESGSLLTDPIKLCEHCAINAHVDLSFEMNERNNPFYDEEDLDY